MHIFYTNTHILHDPGIESITRQNIIINEIPERAKVIFEVLSGTAHASVSEPVDHGLDPIYAVHDIKYVEYLQTIFKTANLGKPSPEPVFPGTFSSRRPQRRSIHPEALPGYYCFGIWTPILDGTWQAAYWSAQSALSAADSLVRGNRIAYAVCRPPGHHAARDLYGGYCYLNNAAIAASYLQTYGSFSNIAILDIDYHHGNGTQEIFYEDPDVFFCSLHADPDQDYPYFWGSAEERGMGKGEGYNLNFPLQIGTGILSYLSTLEKALITIMEFHPNALVLSLGYDIGTGDPEGGFEINTKGFFEIGNLIKQVGIPVLIIQEGGYHLSMLAEWCHAFVNGMQ